MANLVSRDDLKTFMQITGTASDAIIDVYRDMIEAEIEAYVDRNLTENTYTEALYYLDSKFDTSDYTGLDTRVTPLSLYLENYPVNTITLKQGTETVSQADYRVTTASGVVNTDTRLSTNDDNVQATYTAGYTTVSAPADLTSVVKFGVKALYESNDAAVQGEGDIQSKKIKDFSVTYGSNSNSYLSTDGMFKPYLAANKRVLDRYKKVNI